MFLIHYDFVATLVGFEDGTVSDNYKHIRTYFNDSTVI